MDLKLNQAGLSLLECLLSLSLGIGLLLMMSKLYLAIMGTQHMQQAVMQVQQNTRIAIVYLSSAIRHAGVINCGVIKHNHANIYHLQDAYLVNYLRNTIKKGTSYLSVQSKEYQHKQCHWLTAVYFVARASHRSLRGKSIYALFKKVGHAPRVELVDYIQSMDVKYIEWSTQESLWMSHSQLHVQDWSQIKAIRIELLLYSNQQINKSSKYWYQDHWHNSPHHQFYQSWLLYVHSRS